VHHPGTHPPSRQFKLRIDVGKTHRALPEQEISQQWGRNPSGLGPVTCSLLPPSILVTHHSPLHRRTLDISRMPKTQQITGGKPPIWPICSFEPSLGPYTPDLQPFAPAINARHPYLFLPSFGI
jgi:hypothetical protein